MLSSHVATMSVRVRCFDREGLRQLQDCSVIDEDLHHFGSFQAVTIVRIEVYNVHPYPW